MLNNFSFSKVLVLAAHPDDETLGMGGTLAKMASSGIEIMVVILTEGVNSRNSKEQNESKWRIESCKKALGIMGISNFVIGNFRDNALDSYPIIDLVKWVEQVVAEFRPDAVFSTSPFDLNIDHRYVAEIAQIISRPMENSSVNQLFFYEVRSSSEWRFASENFKPNVYFDIDKYSGKKIDALGCYSQELRDFPHPRSIKAINALSVIRGSEAGFNNAEAFVLGFLRNS